MSLSHMPNAKYVAMSSVVAFASLAHLQSLLRPWISLLRKFWFSLAGPRFEVHKAHELVGNPGTDDVLSGADELVQQLLNHGAPLEESCDDLPCTFLLVEVGRFGGRNVAGVVSMSSGMGALDLEAIRKMVRARIPEPAIRQKCQLQNVPPDVVDAIIAGRDADEQILANSGRSAYLGGLVVAPHYQGFGLGKALCRVGFAHAVRIGCKEVIGHAAHDGLIPFYEKMGALSESCRPLKTRPDMPKVKVKGSNRNMHVAVGDFNAHDDRIILGKHLPRGIKCVYST